MSIPCFIIIMFHSLSPALAKIRSYLHINGFIHRDIKAANLLIDDDGTVLLGDLGVATSLSDDEPTHSSRATKRTIRHTQDIGADPGRPALTPIRAKRQSFVGTVSTPAMPRNPFHPSETDLIIFSHAGWPPSSYRASNMIQKQTSGHLPLLLLNSVTAALPGHARPLLRCFSRREYFEFISFSFVSSSDPRCHLCVCHSLISVHDASPTLEREGSRFRYSRALKEVIDSCLVKDPALRPTAQQLLDHPVFKSAKKKNYLVGAVLSVSLSISRIIPPRSRSFLTLVFYYL